MIRARADKFVVTIYDPETRGKQWVGTYLTRKEARAAEAAALLDRDKPKTERGETCDEFANRWLRDYPRKRASTNIGYAERVKKFSDDFAGRPLASLTRVAARKWVLDNPSRHKAVRAMFSDALRDGLIDANPFLEMRLPGSSGRKDSLIPTMEQVAVLAKHAKDLRGPIFEAFVLTAAYTGMRPGELYALKWPQVRLNDMEIDVIGSYSSKSGEETRPKNGLARTIFLPPLARNALAELRRPEGYVFETVTKKRLTGRTLHYYWDPVRVAAGLPGLDFYTLRHACGAYLLNEKRLPAHQVGSQLGHTDGGVLVMKLYGHPSDAMAREAIRAAYSENVIPIRKASGE